MRASSSGPNGFSSVDFPPLASQSTSWGAAVPTVANSSRNFEANSSSPSSSSWRSLFGSSAKLHYFEPTMENGKKIVSISKETHDLGFAL